MSKLLMCLSKRSSLRWEEAGWPRSEMWFRYDGQGGFIKQEEDASALGDGLMLRVVVEWRHGRSLFAAWRMPDQHGERRGDYPPLGMSPTSR